MVVGDAASLGLAERSPRTSLVAANGQVLAITREAYDAVGGHAGVRGEVLDDVALFQQLKRVGRRGALADGTDVASCRMYDGWRDLVTATPSRCGRPPDHRRGGCSVGLLGVTYVVPPLAAFFGSRIGAIGYAGAVSGRALVAHRVGGRVWPDSLLHPASVAGLRLPDRAFLGRTAARHPHLEVPPAEGGWLSTEQLAQRDRLVFAGLRQRRIPVAWVLAGGYQRDAAGSLRPVLEIHDNTLHAFAKVWEVAGVGDVHKPASKARAA